MTSAGRTTHITIVIDEQPYHVEQRTMTGAEIKALGAIPPENRLFLEVQGQGEDIFIPDDRTVELESGEKFYDLPRGIHGAPTLLERIGEEVAQIEHEFGGCAARPQADGSVVLIVGPVALPDGWSTRFSRIVIVVPPGYREERPRGFFAEPGLTLANGAAANTASQAAVAGEPFTYFCWQPANWDPARDGLWKYAKLMAERFTEVA